MHSSVPQETSGLSSKRGQDTPKQNPYQHQNKTENSLVLPLAIAGVVVCTQTAASLSRPWSLVFLLIWLVGSAAFSWKRGKGRVLKTFLFSALLGAFSYGEVFWKQPSSDSFKTLLSTEDLRRGAFEIEGRISGELRRRRPGELKVTLWGSCFEEIQGAFQISLPDLPWACHENIRQGSKVRVWAKVRPVSSSNQLPNPFSYSGYLFRRGILATGWGELISPETKELCLSSQLSFPEKVALRAQQQLGDSDALAVLLAITLGRRDLVGEHVRELFRSTGTSHLLVISGFHVGTVFFLIYTIVGFVWKRVSFLTSFAPSVLPSSLGGVMAASAYAALAGGGPSTTRAVLTLSLLVMGRLVGREASFCRQILLAFCGVNLLYPGAFFEAGPELTFSALFGLLVGEAVYRSLGLEGGGRRWWKLVSRAVLSSSGAWLFTAPIVFAWFRTFVPLGALINAVSIPLYSFVCFFAGALAVMAYSLEVPGSESVLELSVALMEFFLTFLRSIHESLIGTPFEYRTLPQSI